MVTTHLRASTFTTHTLLQSYCRGLIRLIEDIYQVSVFTILSSWQSLAILAQHFPQLLFNLYKVEF